MTSLTTTEGSFGESMRGAVFMTLSMIGFSCNDAMFKLLAGKVPLFQGMFLRGLIICAVLGTLAAMRGELKTPISPRDRRLLGLRSIGELFAGICFLTAIFHTSLANTTAILQSIPLVMTLAAAFLLGEPVGWRRYLAIFVGLVGVLIIIRPGSEGFNSFSLLAVVAVAFVTLRDLTTRLASPNIPALLVSLITVSSVTACTGIFSLFIDWAPVGPREWMAICASATFLILGFHFGVHAMRVGEISVVAPFRYSILIWATLLGWGIYGETPDIWMVVGGALIVATGLYSFHRERLRARHPMTTPPVATMQHRI